jgi:hypothetical protein
MTVNYTCNASEIDSCGRFHKHFTCVTYGSIKLNCTICQSHACCTACNVFKLHTCFFVMTVSYTCKIIIKWTLLVDFIILHVRHQLRTDGASKISCTVCLLHASLLHAMFSNCKLAYFALTISCKPKTFLKLTLLLNFLQP